jgi:hypothetical protein
VRRPTMTMEMVVGPAHGAADRRPPKRLTENAANYPAGNGADRAGNNQAAPRPGRSTDQSACAVRAHHEEAG